MNWGGEMVWLEWLGVVTNVISNYFLFKKRSGYWVWSIAGNILWLIYFFAAHKWMASGLQFTFILFSLYGWWRWRKEERGNEIGDGDERLGIGLSLLVMLLSVRMTNFNGADPILEAVGVSIFSLANWMTMKKWRQSWYVWMIGNIVFGVWSWRMSAYGMVVAQCIFLVMSVWGLKTWLEDELKKKTHLQA